MLKRIFPFVIVITMLVLGTVQAEMSESFQKIIAMIHVPTKNIDGYEINEKIYEQYALVVYGSPTDITKNQRWKDVSNGKWYNEKTKKQGEYRILGYSLTGTVVNNELFPDDYVSGVSPEEWNYIPISNALSSWSNTEKYQTKEQLEYMLTQNLTRKGITYQMTASSIGLDKARLEAYATWKTAGSIFTLKKDQQGGIWEATFHVPPMAENAEFEAKLELPMGKEYQLTENQEEIEIPISYGAEITNLGEYAKIEDIQKISAELEVENNLVDRITASEKDNVATNKKIIIRRADYPNTNQVEISVKNTSVLETCFQSEAPMVDVKEEKIMIRFQEEEKEEEEYITSSTRNSKADNDIPRPVISKMQLFRKTLQNKDQKVSLLTAKKMNLPFICAGQILVVEATIYNSPQRVSFTIEGNSKIQTLDNLTKKFAYDEPKARGETLWRSSLDNLKQSYQLPRNMTKEGGVYRIEYLIPYGTKQTLHSWSTLRQNNQNALEIDKSQLFTRISQPYVIKITASNQGGVVTKSISLDVFERWDTIYNRDISGYVK